MTKFKLVGIPFVWFSRCPPGGVTVTRYLPSLNRCRCCFVLYNCFFMFHSSLTYCTPAENKPREINTTRDSKHALVHVLFHVTRPNHALFHVLFHVTRPNHALFHVLFHTNGSCLRWLSGSCGGSISDVAVVIWTYLLAVCEVLMFDCVVSAELVESPVVGVGSVLPNLLLQ